MLVEKQEIAIFVILSVCRSHWRSVMRLLGGTTNHSAIRYSTLSRLKLYNAHSDVDNPPLPV